MVNVLSHRQKPKDAPPSLGGGAVRRQRRLTGVKNPGNLKRDRPLADDPPQPYAGPRTTMGVYFIRFDRYMKIGHGKNIATRLRSHMADADMHDNPAKIVAVVNGTKADEAYVHRYFNQFRYDAAKHELFHHAVELTDYVRWLRKQGFVEVGDDDKWAGGIVRDLQPTDSAGWLPNATRREKHIATLFVQKHDDYGPREITGDDYYTPLELIALVRDAMGGPIELDPASHAAANQRIGALAFYTKDQDGTQLPWTGRVWLNPPFSGPPGWPEFAEKACAELDRGKVPILMALASCTAITAGYMAPLMQRTRLMVVPHHRFVFWGPHASQATSGHVILIAARDTSALERANAVFASRYRVWRPA